MDASYAYPRNGNVQGDSFLGVRKSVTVRGAAEETGGAASPDKNYIGAPAASIKFPDNEGENCVIEGHR